MKQFLLSLLAISSMFVTSAQEEVEVFLFSGMDGELVLDNGETVTFWGYGELPGNEMTLPAPLLRFNQGDQVTINMFNFSPEAHTIHLHGLDVDQANDGVPQTSFQVLPNEQGTYSFTADFPGTYLYHCHVTTTLHLTMGMYGFVMVEYAEDQLFEEGPTYDRRYEYLFSDLEIETNQNPTQAFPFHEIFPDYFMVNGLSGSQLTDDSSQHLYFENGDRILLRLGSMAYSLSKVIIPEGLNPTVYMSDGRVLPETFSPDTLEIYPGERFSVILQPDDNAFEDIEVEYYDMLNKEYQHTNTIVVEDLALNINDAAEAADANIIVYPNPVDNTAYIRSSTNGVALLMDVSGRICETFNLQDGITPVDLSMFNPGLYFIQNEKGERTRLIIR